MYVRCCRCADTIYQQGEPQKTRDELFCGNCKETTTFEVVDGGE